MNRLHKINELDKCLKLKKKKINPKNPNLIFSCYRSLSWLKKSINTRNFHSKFIFAWISLNSLYARKENKNNKNSEKDKFNRFITNLLGYTTIKNDLKKYFKNYDKKLRYLLLQPELDNEYWNKRNRKEIDEFLSDNYNRKREELLNTNDLIKKIRILWSMLYVVRNQVFHGSSSDKSNRNTANLKKITPLLQELVILLLNQCISEFPEDQWGHIDFSPNYNKRNK